MKQAAFFVVFLCRVCVHACLHCGWKGACVGGMGECTCNGGPSRASFPCCQRGSGWIASQRSYLLGCKLLTNLCVYLLLLRCLPCLGQMPCL